MIIAKGAWLKVARSNDLSIDRINLVTDSNNYMNSLRQNIQLLMGANDMTLLQLSEHAGISYETLKSLIYSDSKDCRMSTVVAIAKAFGISVDELTGAGTMEPVVAESVQICRRLPANYVRFVRWAIRYHERMLSTKMVSQRAVNVMLLECTNEGNVQLTNNFELADIDSMPNIIRPKIFMGFRLPCDNYMPMYGSGDILLIANDRKPMTNEVSVIALGGFVWLAHRSEDKNEDGSITVNYYSIRDGKFRVSEKDIDEHIGYVAGVITEG